MRGGVWVNEQQYRRLTDLAVLVMGTVFALYIRYCFRNFETIDFKLDTSLWYAAVQQQGLAAAGTGVSNYTPTYLYLLYLVSVVLPSLPPVVAIKIPSVLFDFVCAGLMYRIVGLKYPDRRIPTLAFLTVLLAPTVVLNGSLWGQADSIYTAMLLACVYGLMTGRAVLAMLALGAALALKFQTMFIAPCICALWLKRRLPFWTLLLVPVVYAAAMVPAWLEGRSILDLATVYLSQSGTFHNLTRNAPNLYTWLPQRYYTVLVPAGLLLMAGLGVAYVWLVWRSRANLNPARILRLSLLSLLLVPYFLPKMHDRFFFPADVLSIAYGFYFPGQYCVPIAIGFASFFAYQPFLIGHPVLPLRLLALVMGAALLAVTVSAYRNLQQEDATER
jgi:Gpi18-like mannosyltransferase